VHPLGARCSATTLSDIDVTRRLHRKSWQEFEEQMGGDVTRVRSGAKQSDVKRSGAKQSDVKQSGAKQSGAKQSDVKQSGVKQSGVKQSGVKQSGVKQSGVKKSEPKTPTARGARVAPRERTAKLARDGRPAAEGQRSSRAASVVDDVLIGAPGTVDLMALELARATGVKRPRTIAPGVLAVPSGTESASLVFARQCVPRARFIEAKSASALADLVVQALDADTARGWLAGTIALSVSLPDVERKGSRPPEEHPLTGGAQHIVEVLEKKRIGRAAKQDVAPDLSGASLRLELLVTDAWRGVLASAPTPIGDALTTWPVPFAAGRAPVAIDKRAPSSAHRKLDEALRWLGTAPTRDDTVLDLGAAPGGWTHVALRHGARVVAVDRGDMDPRLLANDRVTHVRRDAFAVTLDDETTGGRARIEDADWLVCDIIVEPERTMALLERALACSRLKGFVVTLKLRRPVDVAVIERARHMMADDAHFIARAKCLFHNKTEFTVMGRRRAAS
jgi:hypothetical protein